MTVAYWDVSPDFLTPWYTGTATSSLVPGYLPVALGGHPYLIDAQKFERQTLPSLRDQADTSGEPGEASLNPRGLWRRSQEDWSHGAGQPFLDGRDSDRFRFRTSQGIDPWELGILKLLNDTESKRVSSETNLALTVVGDYLYVVDGEEVYHTADPSLSSPAWTAADIQGGQAAETVTSIASNGYHVWVALGASGVHRTTRGSGTSTVDVPATAMTLVAYANGRLLGADGRVLYEITDPLGTPAASTLHTHDNTDFTWDGIAAGRACIYAWGHSGDKSEVYRIGLEAATTALSVPTFATYLPDGELLHTLLFYAGGIVMGTDKGVRLASVDAVGNLDYGPLIPTDHPVLALEPQDAFCWYGLTDPDAASTGLGRLNLGFFTNTLVPAYCPDLMCAGQGDVLSAVTFADRRYFAVSALGVYGETGDKVASATIESGAIRYGTTERKSTRTIDLRHHALAGSVSVEMKMDEGEYVALASSAVAGSIGPDTPISTNGVAGETAELRFTLNRDGTDATLGPELVRWTLYSLPTPRREDIFSIPIIMRSTVDNMTADGLPHYQDVIAEMDFLADLVRTGRVVALQLGHQAYSVYIESLRVQGEQWNAERSCVEGLVTAVCQTVES